MTKDNNDTDIRKSVRNEIAQVIEETRGNSPSEYLADNAIKVILQEFQKGGGDFENFDDLLIERAINGDHISMEMALTFCMTWIEKGEPIPEPYSKFLHERLSKIVSGIPANKVLRIKKETNKAGNKQRSTTKETVYITTILINIQTLRTQGYSLRNAMLALSTMGKFGSYGTIKKAYYSIPKKYRNEKDI